MNQPFSDANNPSLQQQGWRSKINDVLRQPKDNDLLAVLFSPVALSDDKLRTLSENGIKTGTVIIAGCEDQQCFWTPPGSPPTVVWKPREEAEKWMDDNLNA